MSRDCYSINRYSLFKFVLKHAIDSGPGAVVSAAAASSKHGGGSTQHAAATKHNKNSARISAIPPVFVPYTSHKDGVLGGSTSLDLASDTNAYTPGDTCASDEP